MAWKACRTGTPSSEQALRWGWHRVERAMEHGQFSLGSCTPCVRRENGINEKGGDLLLEEVPLEGAEKLFGLGQA